MVTNRKFNFTFGRFNQDDFYNVLDKLHKLSQSKTPIGCYVKNKFEEHLNLKREIDLETFTVNYPDINWDQIQNLYSWARYIALDKDGDLFVYANEPYFDKKDGNWYPPNRGDMLFERVVAGPG